MIKRLKLTDNLIRQGGWIFFAVSLGSLFNLLYQWYMVRNLTKVDFGILDSLLALLLYISVPTGTLQTAITKFTSSFHGLNQWNKIKIFLSRFGKMVFLFGLAFFLIIALGSGYISSFLQIPSAAPVVIIGVLVLLSLMLPLTLGGLQGLQIFGWFGLNGIVGTGLKLIMGIIFVSLGFGVMGALGAYILASLTMILLSFVPLRRFILEKSKLSADSIGAANPGDSSEEINFVEIYKYFLPVAITLLCFINLINVDIILVKHFFPPIEAGYYAVARMVGKVILFLPAPITIVMFPKVSNLHAQGKNTLPILKKSLVIVGFLCGIAALLCIIFPSLIIRLLSREECLQSVNLVWLFALAMPFFALIYTILFYQLSIHRFNFVYPLIFFTILQTILIVLFHQTLSQVLYILCGISALLFTINLGLILIKNPSRLRD